MFWLSWNWKDLNQTTGLHFYTGTMAAVLNLWVTDGRLGPREFLKFIKLQIAFFTLIITGYADCQIIVISEMLVEMWFRGVAP